MNTDLDVARRRVENIRAHLPSSISVAAVGVRSKTPFLLLAAREALIWQTEELARGACDMLERDDIASRMLLTRAVAESTAFVWRLKDLLKDRDKYTTADLQDKVERMLLGWKKDPEFPQAINIQTMIDHMDRQLPGFRERYDQLSEFAHPNWSGVFGLFAVTHHATYTTQFGRGLRRTPFAAKEQAAIALNAFLELIRACLQFDCRYVAQICRRIRTVIWG
jgi:hypothetical protein